MEHIVRRGTITIAAALGLALGGTACSNSEEPSTADPAQDAEAGTSSESTAGADSAASETADASTLPAPAGDGVTTTDDVYGPGCDQLPTDGAGSVQDLVEEQAGTGVVSSPEFGTLGTAISAAGLEARLDDPNAQYTVFAPLDPAFAELPGTTLTQLLADPLGQLSDVLSYHVVPQRYDAEGLAAAGTVTTLQGSELTITGDPGSLVVDAEEQASVVCGNIPTRNATIFVVDQVLLPPA